MHIKTEVAISEFTSKIIMLFIMRLLWYYRYMLPAQLSDRK